VAEDMVKAMAAETLGNNGLGGTGEGKLSE